MRYSGFSLLRNSLSGNTRWPNIMAQDEIRSEYEIIIVGGGGHGLATAHYLASRFGIHNVLVLESGWIGGGNTGRNTTIVRSDYLLDASFALKNFALELWKTLGQELNFNLMYSPRGYVDLAHSDGELEHFTVRANAMCPGPVDTPLIWESAKAFENEAEAVANAAKATLLKRLGNPEDIAKLALFLASEESSFITGTSVNIDGGITV